MDLVRASPPATSSVDARAEQGPSHKRKAEEATSFVGKKRKIEDTSESAGEDHTEPHAQAKSKKIRRSKRRANAKAVAPVVGSASDAAEEDDRRGQITEHNQATATSKVTVTSDPPVAQDAVVAGGTGVAEDSVAIEELVVTQPAAKIKETATTDEHRAVVGTSKDDTGSAAEETIAQEDPPVVAKPTGWFPHSGRKNTGRFEKLDKPLSGWYRQQAVKRSLGQSRSGLAHLHLPARRWQYFSKYDQKEAAPPAYSVLDPRRM
ncbi:hypothetical protein LTR56_002919 [Elasticomyces elasticus]|nr:hypothetical protein LTR56_002919 [Elasticomyces elasticus]KAK3665122.1 hypothetical protein LTR22_003928 [Elasticomyces elasticus]KAK4930705.1 hypothetical protein LTR49_002793 [Elasticomyces elasticus]KAK5759928.1 hypothetical protein LTS12_009976 [Elasticomyces elasticus]